MESDTLTESLPERRGGPRSTAPGSHFAGARAPLTPRETSPFVARLRALGSLLAIVALLLGVPIALAVLVGWPLPTELPSWDRVRDAFQRDGVPVEVLINGLAVVVWVAWAQLAWAIGAEAAAVLKGRTASRAGFLPGTQLLARHLVASAALVVSSFGMIRPAMAGPLTALQEAEPVAEPALRASEPAAVAGASGSSTTPAAPASTTTPSAAAEKIHEVKRGDTFWGLAQEYLGSGLRWREIRDRNVGRAVAPGHVLSVGEDHIEVGWRLLVPGSSSASLRSLSSEPTTAPPEVAPPGTLLASLAEDGAATSDDDQVGWSGPETRGARSDDDVDLAMEPIVFTFEAEAPATPAAATPAPAASAARPMPAATPTAPEWAPAAPAPTPLADRAEAAAPPQAPPAPGPVTVEQGDHFWALAERQLEEAWGRPVTAEEVAPYWRSLVEANRASLASGDPDLIYPGEEFSVPSPPVSPAEARATPAPAPDPAPTPTPPADTGDRGDRVDEAPADEASAEEADEAGQAGDRQRREADTRVESGTGAPATDQAPADEGASDGAPPEETAEELGSADDSVAAPPAAPAPTPTTTASPTTTAAPTTTAPPPPPRTAPPTTAPPTTVAPRPAPTTTAPPTTEAGSDEVPPEETTVPTTAAPTTTRPDGADRADRADEEARGAGAEEDGARSADDAGDDDEATVPVAPVLATAALAALVLAALARRRRSRSRSVRPGDIVEPRLADDIAFERGLAVAAGDVLDVVAAASRALGAILAQVDLPVVTAMVVAPSRTVTIHFAEPVDPLPPFGPGDGGDTWEMYPEDIDFWVSQESAVPVLDTLTAVGQTDDDEWVFLDLESLGAIELAGDPTVAAEMAQSMVAELSLQPLAEPMVDLTIVGMDELAPSVVEQGVVRIDHLDQDLVHRVERSAEQTGALLRQGGLRSTAAARARGLAGDGLFVMVVAYGGAEPVDPVLLERVAAAATPGGRGVAIVAVGPMGPGTTRVIVTPDGRAHIPRLGITVNAARLARHDLDRVADLLAREPDQSTRGASRQVRAPEEEGAEATAAQPVPRYEEPNWRYCVRIFADHLVQTPDGQIVSFRYGDNPDVPNKNTHRGPELLAYLALSGRAASATDVRDHLWWDRPVALGTVNKLLYGTRKVLGGADLLSLAQDDPVGRYRLSPEVLTDVELLSHALEHAHAIATQDPDTAVETLRVHLDAIEAVAFRSGAMGQGLAEWAAAYRVIDRVEQPVVDAALLVAKLRTEAGPDGYDDALWAVEQGLVACPINEALVRAAMDIEARMGSTEGVNNRYLTLATTLARDELEPETETSDLRARLGGSTPRDRGRRLG